MASNRESMAGDVRTYFKVFGALMGLTAVTVAVSYVHLIVSVAVAAGVAGALLIALLKGSLVAGFFMHLIGEQRLVFGILLFSGFLLAALILLPVLGAWDQVGTPRPAAAGSEMVKEP